MQKSGFEVAIIDDGVNGESYPGILVRESYLVTTEGSVKEYWCKKEESGHGSACAAIISKYAPKVSIVSLKVLNGPVEDGAAAKVITALEWCEEHDVKVCHLSIGVKSIKYYGLFQTIIRRMKQKGHIFIAAMANDNGFALPACLDGVISVKADNHLLADNYYKGHGRLGEPDYFASGRHVLRDVSGNEAMVTEGNSFAAPVITAEVLRKHVSAGTPEQCRDNFDYISQYFDASGEILVPVVVFHGEKNKILKQAWRFKAYLECDGYLAVIAADRGSEEGQGNQEEKESQGNWEDQEIQGGQGSQESQKGQGSREDQEGIVRLDYRRSVEECLALMQAYYDVDLILLCVSDKACYGNGDLYIGDTEQVEYGEIVKQLEEAAENG